MTVSSLHPMRTTSQSSAPLLKQNVSGRCSVSLLRKQTDSTLNRPKLTKRLLGACTRTRETNGVVCSATYPYSSGPHSRQNYGYRTTIPRTYEEQEAPEGNIRSYEDLLRALSACTRFVVAVLTRCFEYFAPEGTLKETIQTGVQSVLILLMLIFARAILSFIITIGSVGMLMFVGYKFIQIQASRNQAPYQAASQGPSYHQQQAYYIPRTNYPPPNMYIPVDGGVINPWTGELMTVWREPVQPPMGHPGYQYQQMNYYSRFG